MTATDDVELDLLEQCRAGDRSAFRALVAFWGDPALRLALTFTNDEERARTALSEGLLECWRQLPSLHSETQFRPFLFGLVARAALAQGSAPGTGRLDRCLEMMEPDARAVAILSGQGHLDARELARANGTSMLEAALSARRAMRSLQASLGFKPLEALSAASSEAHLDRKYFEHIAPELEDQWLIEVRRIVQRPPHDAWGVLTDPTAIPAWISAGRAHVRGGGSLYPGGHIAARGRIADLRASHDESIITIVEPPVLLAWTTRSRITPFHAPIEFRWSVVIDEAPGGSELRHRLRGVALPHGPVVGTFLRRAYDRVAGSMQASMHRGLERLASLIEARPV